MRTELTFRLDAAVVARAEAYAAARGTSVSGLVEDYVRSVTAEPSGDGDHGPVGDADDWRASLPPITPSLVGIAEAVDVTEEGHKRALEEKHR